MPEALSNSARGCDMRDVAMKLKMSQVTAHDGVLAPHREFLAAAGKATAAPGPRGAAVLLLAS